MRTRSLATFVGLLLLPTALCATCYTVDGEAYADSSFVACDSSGEYSACCASNKGSRSDICMSSGLCYAQDGKYRGFIYMNGCTDSSGVSDDCPHFCPDASNDWNGGSKVTSWNVLQCNVGEYCCREAGSETNCCSNSSAIITTDIGTLLVATTSATTSSATGTSATTTGGSSTGTSATTAKTSGGATGTSTSGAQESQPSCSTNTTAVVGGAVGGALGAALLASLGALAFVMKRRKDNSYASSAYHRATQPPASSSVMAPTSAYMTQPAKPPQQLDGWSSAQELPDARSRYEMQ